MTVPPIDSPPGLPQLARTQKILAASLGLIIALCAVVVFLLSREEKGLSMDDPDVVDIAIQQMMTLGDGLYDSHTDPDVAKVLQPGMDHHPYFGEIVLTTNSFGVREKEWTSPKAPGTLRVVILGDSFVLGAGINAEQRMGTHLERYLRERLSGFEGNLEVLQIGMGSWNVRAECSFARRQLSLLKPDLMIHILVNNDLDDCLGVRGFGGFATVTPQHPRHVTGIVQRRYPKQVLKGANTGWLSNGMDWESRSRFKDALADLKELQAAVVRQGGKYQVLFAWGKFQQAAHFGLGQYFEERDSSYMSPHFGKQIEHRVSERDGHWGAFGNEQVAKMLYALITERGLLPQVDLPTWTDADKLMAEYFGRGREEAKRDRPIGTWLSNVPIASEVKFGNLSDAEKAQIHGGIANDGMVRPYGSMILAAAGNTLEIHGKALARPEIKDAKLRVFLDEFQVGTVELATSDKFEFTATLPDQLELREYVSLRFLASDYVYTGSHMRECVSFQLERVAIHD